MERWRPRGRPSFLVDGEEGATPGGRGDSCLEHVGARTSGDDLVAQAQAVKVVTVNTTAASVLAADGGHAR